MNFTEIYQLYGFYQHELKENMLGFWLPRCEDTQYGGFVNCFDNRGEHLISHDKYAWSQGRFVWVFARLASTPAPSLPPGSDRNFCVLPHKARTSLCPIASSTRRTGGWFFS